MVFEPEIEVDGFSVWSLLPLWLWLSLSSLPKNSSVSGFRGGKSALELQERNRRRGVEPVLTETLQLPELRPLLETFMHSGTTSK